MPEITITINDTMKGSCNEECARVQVVEDSGKKQSRFVTMDSLMEAFHAAVVRERVDTAVGEIPFGYYDAQIGTDKGLFCARMVAVLPPGRHMMRYEETMYDVCLPGLVFCFHVERGRLYNTKVFTIKDEKPGAKSQLYQYPFGNVGKDGNVCWGQNQLPQFQSLKALEEAMMLFIQSPTNDDYYNGQTYCNHAGLSLRELFEFLKDQDSYPEEYMVPAKSGRNIQCLGNLTPWRKKTA